MTPKIIVSMMTIIPKISRILASLKISRLSDASAAELILRWNAALVLIYILMLLCFCMVLPF